MHGIKQFGMGPRLLGEQGFEDGEGHGGLLGGGCGAVGLTDYRMGTSGPCCSQIGLLSGGRLLGWHI
jgi:hypothetical protein